MCIAYIFKYHLDNKILTDMIYNYCVRFFLGLSFHICIYTTVLIHDVYIFEQFPLGQSALTTTRNASEIPFHGMRFYIVMADNDNTYINSYYTRDDGGGRKSRMHAMEPHMHPGTKRKSQSARTMSVNCGLRESEKETRMAPCGESTSSIYMRRIASSPRH